MKCRVIFKECKYWPQSTSGWWDGWHYHLAGEDYRARFETEQGAIDYCNNLIKNYKLKNHPVVIMWESE